MITTQSLKASLAGTAPTRLIVRLHGTVLSVHWHGDNEPVGWSVNSHQIDEVAMAHILEDLQFGARIR